MSTALAAMPLVAPGAESGQEVVAEVVLEGTKRVHPNRVLGQLRTRPGDTLREAILGGDIARLEELGYFIKPTMRIERLGGGEVRVIFEVTELPYVGEVRIDGVGYFARQSLEKLLVTQRGGYLNPLTVEVDARRMMQKLREDSFLHAEVVPRITVEPDSQVGSVVFEVDPGQKVRVGRLLFDGMPEGAHRYFLQPRLFNQQGGIYDRDLVTWDREIVQRYVQEAGYLDATVGEPRIEFFDQVKPYEARARTGPRLVPDGRLRDRVVIGYRIEPGERYRLGQVNFIGNTVISEAELREAFALPSGHLYERRELDEAKDRALGLLRDNGYALAQFIEDPVVDRATRVVDLTLVLQEGDRYRVGRIDIFGNTITKDAVIRRALRLRPGQLWSDEDRQRSEREIARTGVVESDPRQPIRVRPDYSTVRPDSRDPEVKEVDVEVDIQEARTGRFSFNIGFSTAQGVIGQVQFSEQNFDLLGLLTGGSWRGAAHRLSASASWSEDRTSISTSWRNPHVYDSDYSLGVSLARTDSTNLDWDELRHSASVSVGRNFLDNDLRLSLGYGIYHLKADDIDFDASDAAFDGQGSYLNNYLQFSQDLDLLDNRRLPTSGFSLDWSQRITGSVLPADDEFVSLDFGATGYIPLFRGELGGVTYLRLRHTNRLLEPIGDNEAVPFYDRIYGGGPAPRHRGFDNLDLGPFANNRNGVLARQGGTSEWLSTVEVVFPIQGLNSGLRAVLFSDIGNVWGEGDNIDPGDLRTAIGIGMRFPPQFPIALDYAWLLDRRSGESAGQFHFSLSGFAF